MPGKRRIAEHIEVTWLDRQSAPTTCPNCGWSGAMAALLDIDYRPPDAVHRFILQVCPHCQARFVDNPEMMDYATEELIEIGWNRYQLQLGAGVWPISAPLTRIDQPAGARILEIGGAYGFGLDFGTRARGWQGVGYDPSPLAAFGARELGLTIHQRYFTEADLADGPWDVVIATEVIEHLPQPPEFLALLRRAVSPSGVLVLTTPDAEWITPELAAGALMPLLSPGAHVVLQTAASLRLALLAAGFTEVVVLREATSLIAYAGLAPFKLRAEPAAGRTMFRGYLVERAALSPPSSDLCLGFAGRGLFEAANDGDRGAAEAAWQVLTAAVAARFGLDLERLTELPPGAGEASLAELAQRMPLGLGMILFGRVMLLAGAKADRKALLPKLRIAQRAVAALQAALARRSLTDGLSADIGRVIEREILLCQAEAADPACLPGLLAGDEALRWRGFVALVNAPAADLAERLKQTLPALPGADVPAGLRRDALLSLANFALGDGRDPLEAVSVAEALRVLGQPEDTILLAAFTRLVNAGRHAEAEALDAAQPCFAGLDTLSGVAADDARIAAVLLDLQRGRTERAVQRAERLADRGADPAVLAPLLVDGFVRLVNEGRFDAAAALAQTRAIERQLARCPEALAQDALAALLLLELQPGGTPTRIVQRVATIAEARFSEPRLQGLAFAAFVTLVNAGEFAAAGLLRHLLEPMLLKLKPPYDAAERNALFAAGMLYLQARDDWRRAAAVLARLRDALVRLTPPGAAPDELFWPALRGEVLALHRLQRGAEATVLLQSFTRDIPGAPPDLLQQLAGEPA
jgi:SAM-dependent methyltransferase